MKSSADSNSRPSDLQARLRSRDFSALSRDQCPESEEARADAADLPYRQSIGSMVYLAVGTRPDLAQPLAVLSQFFINLGRAHWNAALRLLAYVKATSDVGL